MMYAFTCKNPNCTQFGGETIFDYDLMVQTAEANDQVVGPVICGTCNYNMTETRRQVPDGYVPKPPLPFEEPW